MLTCTVYVFYLVLSQVGHNAQQCPHIGLPWVETRIEASSPANHRGDAFMGMGYFVGEKITCTVYVLYLVLLQMGHNSQQCPHVGLPWVATRIKASCPANHREDADMGYFVGEKILFNSICKMLSNK